MAMGNPGCWAQTAPWFSCGSWVSTSNWAMTYFDVPNDLQHLVAEFDIIGSPGHKPCFDRGNLLMSEISTTFEGNEWIISGFPMTAEGGAAKM